MDDDTEATPWPTIAAKYRDQPEQAHLADIADSVLTRRADATLTAHLHETALVVTAARPGRLTVHGLPPAWKTGLLWIRIEHRTPTGRLEAADRPATDAEELFWQMAEKAFGPFPGTR